MHDRKKAIDHLQIMHTWATFALEKDQNFFTEKHMEHIAEWTEDTLALINEQQTRIDVLESLRRIEQEGR